MLSLRHKGAVGALHLLACLACGPKLAECTLTHPGGEVIVEVRVIPAERFDQFLDGLTCGVAVVGAGRGDRREAVVLDRVDDFLLAKVDERTDDGGARLIEIGFGTERVQLP